MERHVSTSGIFCNRTLNLNAVRAVGYDMDYTLIHYHTKFWEELSYAYIRENLEALNWPVGSLRFDPDLIVRGLVIDTEHGNVVKANRFGYIKRAHHGVGPMEFDEQRRVYQRTLVDLHDPRWVFLNTLFSISEGCMYMQLVDLLDRGALPGCMGYLDLFRRVRHSVDEAHMEGRLKGEIISNPEPFTDVDPNTPLALLDQKNAGKKLLLITNSEWAYTAPMMRYAFDPFLPGGMTWRDLFDIILVGARKPVFFTSQAPAFEVVSEDGLLREHRGPLVCGRAYVGGSATLVEHSLRLIGEEILYVGDHISVDVGISKSISRWRTALVVRELEEEIAALEQFVPAQEELSLLMDDKEALEAEASASRLALQRIHRGYGPPAGLSRERIEKELPRLYARLKALDERIAPLAKASSLLLNEHWGPTMRTGNDKSLLAREVERYADIYMGRVSNFLNATPFAFLRSQRGSLPHDPPSPSRPI